MNQWKLFGLLSKKIDLLCKRYFQFHRWFCLLQTKVMNNDK